MTDLSLKYYRYLVAYVCRWGHQPSRKDVANHFGVFPRAAADMFGRLVRDGLLSEPEVFQERCYGLPHVRFRAKQTDGDPDQTGPTYPATAEIAKAIITNVERVGFQPTLVELAETLGRDRRTVITDVKRGVASGLFAEPTGRHARAIRMNGIRYVPFFEGAEAAPWQE